MLVALGVLFFVGRRRQAAARAKAAEQRANAMGTGRAARRSGGGGGVARDVDRLTGAARAALEGV